LQFFGDRMGLNTASAFKAHLTRATNKKWVVFAKRPFAGPEQVLAYLARYTNRVAISNHVAFRWKDYREDGSYRSEVMPLAPHEFMRRFLLHVLPDGFHRIRHYGLFANGHRAEKLALCRKLLDVSAVAAATSDERDNADDPVDSDHPPPCPCCGGRIQLRTPGHAGCRPAMMFYARFKRPHHVISAERTIVQPLSDAIRLRGSSSCSDVPRPEPRGH